MQRPAANEPSQEPQPFVGTFLDRPWRWLDERYHLDDLVQFVRHKEVPVGGHAMIWYYFGGIALFFFFVQILTGILLLMYYEAGENASYESMKYIVGKVPFGWLIRSIHCWSAHLMVMAVLIHMFSVFFLRSYRRPRELTWMTGFALLGLALCFGFSGYLLPWNELSYFATSVGTDSLKSIPWVGEWLLEVLRGGTEVSIRTLHRFFALHVCVLPIVTFALIAFHLVLVQRQGMAEPDPENRPRELGAMRFFPNFVMRDALLWVLCVNILAILAVWLPHGPGIPGMEWNLGEKADPLQPAYPGIKPEWYFLWIYQMLKEFPPHILGMEGPQACMFLSTLLMAAWFLVPLLNRSSQRGRPSPGFTDFGVAAFLFLTFLTLKAWDLGVGVPHGEDPWAKPELVRMINRNSAGLVLLLGLGIILLRWRLHHSRHFAFTTIALLQAILHGFAGLSYLNASGICTVLFAAAVFLHARRTRTAVVLALLLIGAPFSRPASAAQAAPVVEQVPEEKWPADFKTIFNAKAEKGAVVSPAAQAQFRRLPGHAQALFFSAVERGMLSSAEQLKALLSLNLDDRKIELLLSDNCVLCHTNPDMQTDATLFRLREAAGGGLDPYHHLDLREVVSDVHLRQGLMCSGCHGGSPSDDSMSDEIYARWPAAEARKLDRTWIPDFCTARCHGNAEFMRRFNPSLPVDQMLKYKESRHGQLLLGKKDSKAAQCVSCHGTHGIRNPESPASSVNAANIPATCGRCHADSTYMAGYTLADGKTPIPTDQLEKYRRSVHGRALLVRHDLGAPACNDCHGNHAALPPEVSHIAQVCRTCHVINGTLFDGSPHKKAFITNRWPECETCHGKHDIQKTSDEMLAVGKPTSVCDPCHSKHGTPACTEACDYFYRSLVRLRKAEAEIESDAAELAEMGMEVDDLRFGAGGLADSLRQSRSLIHSFNRTDFSRPYEAGMKSAAELQVEAQNLRREYRFRRNWLVVSTLVITIFAILLYLRIKVADRQGGYRPPAASAH
ncbi:MAG: cytochrome b N-terminal domain-containing protein [Acidobacteriota bacterium]